MMASISQETDGRGVLTAAISNAMVGVLRRYTGRGPTQARTTVDNDVIVCVMRATLTRGEQSLVEHGRQEVVLESRRAFQDTMEAEAVELVQQLSGRRVTAFMSSNHIDPDLAVEVFILESEPTEDHEAFNGERNHRLDRSPSVDVRPTLRGAGL